MAGHKSKRLKCGIVISLIAVVATLSGCYRYDAVEVDTVTYAMLIGIDRNDSTGALRTSVVMPITRHGTQNEFAQSEKGDSEKAPAEELRNKTPGYVTTVVETYNWYETKALLDSTLPYRPDFSQIHMLVFSEALARSDSFSAILGDMVEDESLGNAVQVAICQGSAVQHLAGLEVPPGVRLGMTLKSLLEHMNQVGVIPYAPLSGLYLSMHSLYATPIAVLTANAPLDAHADPTAPITATGPDNQPLPAAVTSQYNGCALFDRSRMVGTLNGYETQLLLILRGQRGVRIKTFGHAPVAVSSYRTPRIHVDISGDAPRIDIEFHLTVYQEMTDEDAQWQSMLISSEIRDLIVKCQRLHVDPFGFADRVARRFLTVNDLVAYDWLTQFERAEVNVKTQIHFRPDGGAV